MNDSSPYTDPTHREAWIDAVKGVAIILVIAGHCGLPYIIENSIYFFHMPLFFMISGYLYRSNSNITFKETIRRRASKLLYPYYVFGVLIIIFNTLKNFYKDNNLSIGLPKRIIALLYGNFIWENNSEYIGTLWFLAALFWVNIIFYYFNKINKNSLKIIFMLLICTLGFVIDEILSYERIRLPCCIDIALVAFGFSAIGAYIRPFLMESKGNLLLAAILFCAGMGIGILNLHYMQENCYAYVGVSMLTMNYGCIPYFILCSVFMSVGVLLFILKISLKFKYELLEHIGRISMLVMVIHIYVIQVVRKIPLLFGYEINCWLLFVISSLISVVLSFVAEKNFSFLYDFKFAKKLFNKK